MYYNRNSIINLVTDVFCNGEDEKDYKDIVKLQAQLQEQLTIGGDPEKIANNEYLIKLLGIGIDVVATSEILSNIDVSHFEDLRLTLLRDRFREFLCNKQDDKRRLYELIRVLHENSCGELGLFTNLRYEDDRILFEAAGITLEITGYAYMNYNYKDLTFNIGGRSRTVLLSEIDFCKYPDYIITNYRAWAKLNKRDNSSALYFPTRPLEAEFVSSDVIDEYSKYYPYVDTSEVVYRHIVNDMYNIGGAFGGYRVPSRDEIDELKKINNSNFIVNEYNLQECCGKYACAIYELSANQFKSFINNRDKLKGFKLIWDDSSNRINL